MSSHHDMERLGQALQGNLDDALLREVKGTDEVPEPFEFPPHLVPDERDFVWARSKFREWMAEGQFLLALALLKVLAAKWGIHSGLQALLSEALRFDDSERSTEPLPREFLGTARSKIAWSVIERDSLQFEPYPESGEFGSRTWVLREIDISDDDRFPNGMVLVWRSTTGVAGTLRPAGQRKVGRRRLELSANLLFYGDTKSRGLSKIEVEVQDLSASGAGVQVRDRFGRLVAEEVKGDRVRLELRRPGAEQRVSVLADIRWAESSADTEHGRVCKLGLQFIDPQPEFLRDVEELLSPGKGDVQYLWSLWESDNKA